MFTKPTPSTLEAHTCKPLRNCEAQEVAIFEAERSKDGKTITYGGATYLLDGSVILLDVVHYRCCLYDPSHIYRAEIKLSSKPHSVAHMGQRRVAVSLPEENMIQILEVGTVFTVERNVYTDWPCYALAIAEDDKIVVCYKTQKCNEFVMINLDGDKKCTMSIQCHGTKPGPYNTDKIYLAYDKLRKRTCVLMSDVVYVILKDGSERFRCPNRYVNTDYIFNGIDYDKEGNLYFITQQNGINQVSVNGDHLHSWAFKCLSPTAFCFHPNGRDFIVATTTGEVHFFKLQ